MSNIFDFSDDNDESAAPIYDNISALKPEPAFLDGLNPEQKDADKPKALCWFLPVQERAKPRF